MKTDRELVEELFPLDDGDGPAAPLAAGEADRLVAAVMAAALVPIPEGGGGEGGPEGVEGGPPDLGLPPPPTGAEGLSASWLVAAATAVVLGAGTTWLLTAPGPTTTTETPPVETPVVVPIPEPETTPEPDPEPPTVPTAEAPSVRPEPGDLLERANQARRSRRWAEAERLYSQVVNAAPRSRAAQVARVASGALRLEHLSDPRGALTRYRAARRARGPLAAEAAFGEARALRALGRGADERAALEALLRQHRASPWATAAESRLRELDR